MAVAVQKAADADEAIYLGKQRECEFGPSHDICRCCRALERTKELRMAETGGAR